MKHTPEIRDSFSIHAPLGPGGTLYGQPNHPPSKSDKARIVYVAGWARSVPSDIMGQGACTRAPCFGFQFGINRAIREAAEKAAQAAEPYTCVQWRPTRVRNRRAIL